MPRSAAQVPWLLILAVTAAIALPAISGCGGHPAESPAASAATMAPPPFRLVEVAAARGLEFRHSYGSRSPITIVETMGGGCACIDFDRDGWTDVFMVSSGQDFQKPRQTPGCRLFRNRGGTGEVSGAFEDVTAKAGIAIDGYAMGCCVGDYDNDGWDDLFITGYGRNFLLRNEGDGTFRDVTEAAGIHPRPGAWGTGCAFIDVDRDGRLDLYVANYVRYDPKIPLCPAGDTMTGCTPSRYQTQRNELYLNRGGGRFEECAVSRGADDPGGAGLGVLVSDFDGDGWADIFVANDGTPNALLRNLKGRFKNIGPDAGVAFGEGGEMRAGMGTDAGDYDGDGHFDIVVTNFFHEPNSLYRNPRFPLFDDVSYASGIGSPSVMRLGFGVSFVDLDSDGKPDLYVGNGHVYDNVEKFSDAATFEQRDQIMLNQGGGRFTEVLPSTGAYPETRSVSRGVAMGDFNNDGTPDLLINDLGRPARLLENQPSRDLHWLGLKLQGTRSNRSAIGARVELRGPGGLQVREVRSGGSYLSQPDLRVLFGLGKLDRPDQVSIRIRWPAGEWQAVRPAALNRYLTVRESPGGAPP